MVTLASTLPSQATVRQLAFSQCKERVAVDIAIALGVLHYEMDSGEDI